MFQTIRPWIASATCLLVLQIGCDADTKWSAVDSMIQVNFGDVPQISTDSLAVLLNEPHGKPAPVLLDARQPEEYAVSHLPGATRVDPEAKAFPELDSLDASTPVVVYCSVGYRSARVTEQLREQGFTAYNLTGSIFRWANEGRAVVRGWQAVREVHPYDSTWGDLLDEDLHAFEPGRK